MRASSLLRFARVASSHSWLDCSLNVQLNRFYSSDQGAVLYRDFIQQSLYHPEQGYFNKPQPPIRRLAQPINFNRILNQAEYKLVLSKIYKQLQVDWLTPVEVFAPWYGRALAHYMLECRKHTLHSAAHQPLAIVEIGGGTGTLAASVLLSHPLGTFAAELSELVKQPAKLLLKTAVPPAVKLLQDYIAEKQPVTYSCMSYTTIEISSSLAQQQRDYIVDERGHGQVWRCVRGDASQPGAWADVAAALPAQHSMQQHAFVLLMEVLDNLPHDRVMRASPDAPWQQVAVQQQPCSSSGSSRSGSTQQQQQQHSYTEVLQPANDPLVQRCLAALYPEHQSISSSSSSMKSWLQQMLGLQTEDADPVDLWLPTRCLQLLEVLHAVVPSHTIIAADFDALPDIVVPGRNAPLVSGREGAGVTVDYDTVLVPWGAADIFFPTDFDGLCTLYTAAADSGPVVYAAQAAAVAAASSSKFGSHKQRQGLAGNASSSSSSSSSVDRVSCSHSSTADFMSAFAEAKQTRLLSGYNPLVQDWQNTRVFVGQSAFASDALESTSSV